MERLSIQLGIEGDVIFTGWKKCKRIYGCYGCRMYTILVGSASFTLEPWQKKPIVATSVGGIPEVVDNGKTGILIPPSRPEDMARAIINLIGNKRIAEEMGEAGKQRVRQLFSIEQMIMHYEKLYFDLLKRNKTWKDFSYF